MKYIESDDFRHLLATTQGKIEQDPVNKYVHIREFVVELKAYEEKPIKEEKVPKEEVPAVSPGKQELVKEKVKPVKKEKKDRDKRRIKVRTCSTSHSKISLLSLNIKGTIRPPHKVRLHFWNPIHFPSKS